MTIAVNKTYFGDCREVLRQFIAEGVKVQMICTSPPYLWLRQYVTGVWEGGNPNCDHLRPPLGGHGKETINGPTAEDNGTRYQQYNNVCGKCGAKQINHGQEIGQEDSPQEYVENLVEVFRLVREVLSDDGVVWLNLGSSYAGSGKGDNPNGKQSTNIGTRFKAKNPGLVHKGFKPKDLIPIPWMVAMALQQDGWWLRQDIIWEKPNQFPESVTDRCVKSHEYILLLTKRAHYFYDHITIKERGDPARKHGTEHNSNYSQKSGRRDGGHYYGGAGFQSLGMRNKRSVWTVATESYRGGHYAVFPQALIEPMILAGTSERGHCPACGKRWVRVVEKFGETTTEIRKRLNYSEKRGDGGILVKQNLDYAGAHGNNIRECRTTGWKPTCTCDIGPVPDIVLDPFMGSGTTGQVAQRLGRAWLGIELNPDYAELQAERSQQMGLSF